MTNGLYKRTVAELDAIAPICNSHSDAAKIRRVSITSKLFRRNLHFLPENLTACLSPCEILIILDCTRVHDFKSCHLRLA